MADERKSCVQVVASSLSMSCSGSRKHAGWSARHLTVLVCLVALSCPVSLVAQSTQGSLLGAVQDASGAVVPGAEVKIVSLTEGSVRIFTTDSAGKYLALDLKPDRYRVEVAKAGFVHQVVNDVALLARQERRAHGARGRTRLHQ